MAEVSPSPAHMEWKTGASVVLRTTFGEEIKSSVFAYDKKTNCLLLKEPGTHGGVHNLRFLKANFVEELVSSEGPAGGVLPAEFAFLPVVDIARGKAREERAVIQAKAEAKNIGQGVTREAQAVFDALIKTMPCEWNGKTILVLDCVFVAEPYTPAACSTPDATNTETLERVRKVLLASRGAQAS